MQYLWSLFVELRKELVECQKIRAQIIGFKITFVSATVGLLASEFENLHHSFFIIPAFAAIFFDFLINSYSFSIKRIGLYIREKIEPELRFDEPFSENFLHWQAYLNNPTMKQRLAGIGNLGLTALACGVGVAGQIVYFDGFFSVLLILLLLVFFVLDNISFKIPLKIIDRGGDLLQDPPI